MQCESIQVLVKRSRASEDLPLPQYATSDSAGLDLVAAVTEETVIQPGKRFLIPTGLYVAIPPGYEGQVRPRSGLALNHGIGMVNSPGTIDADYRGEVKVIIINHGEESFTIQRGDRIAQLVIVPIARAEMVQADFLPETNRNDGGFGHTGT